MVGDAVMVGVAVLVGVTVGGGVFDGLGVTVDVAVAEGLGVAVMGVAQAVRISKIEIANRRFMWCSQSVPGLLGGRLALVACTKSADRILVF